MQAYSQTSLYLFSKVGSPCYSFDTPQLTVIILVYAAVSSLSLSFFATAVDSVFDPMSNLLLWRLHRLSKKLDTNKWPVGGARLETIGNICYGTPHRVFPSQSFNCSQVSCACACDTPRFSPDLE